jgi:outer membrane lipoprotein SlyB
MRTARLASIATGSMLAAMLGACANPTMPHSVPVGSYPATYPSPYPAAAPASLEYGRITNIEVFQGGTAARGMNVPGAILGAVAGAVVGNVAGRAVGGSRTRDTAAVLGGVGGAVIGSGVGNANAAPGNPVYRVTVQTDRGGTRLYDVPATGDLRIGDRVRVENGVIYRG